MKIVLAVGARPNFMKIAPVIRALKKFKKIRYFLVHTGQHYDHNMSASFFKDLGIPKPDINLGVGSASHTVQTAEIMKRLEKVLTQERPDYVVVVGDVNSTLAAALAASKLSIKIAHIESGFRSFDRSMPEEINRLVTDHLSQLLFTADLQADANLLREGAPRKNIYRVGDVMVDNLFYELRKIKRGRTKVQKGFKPYGVLTLHRQGNVDHPAILRRILKAVNHIAARIPVYFPAHPRTLRRLKRVGFKFHKNVQILKPMRYPKFLDLCRKSALVLTDSGGVQLETSVLDIPCLTLRDTTERWNTVHRGTNTLAGTQTAAIIKEAQKILAGRRKKSRMRKMWDGKAAERVVKILWENRNHGAKY